MIEIKQLKGLQSYEETLLKMENAVIDIVQGKLNEQIWFLEHKDVYTAGSSSEINHKTWSKDLPKLIKVNRGGKITYHGPGQIVIYLIINLKKRGIGLIDFISKLEGICIEVFAKNEIKLVSKKEKNRGLWIKKSDVIKKIIFIGLRYSKGVVYHGLSINFNVDLNLFRKINPCGLEANEISSLDELGINYNKKKIINDLKVSLETNF
jgi:lipoyl(octanoyl) transferase